jgi:hypothetical protein
MPTIGHFNVWFYVVLQAFQAILGDSVFRETRIERVVLVLNKMVLVLAIDYEHEHRRKTEHEHENKFNAFESRPRRGK